MKKLINILFKVQLLIFLIGSVSNNYSQYIKTNEQTTSYTAGNDNHIFEVGKDGAGDWMDIVITVHLEKLQFKNTSDNSTYGWNTGNPIPTGWNVVIKSVKDSDGDDIPAGNINSSDGSNTVNGKFLFPKAQMAVQTIDVVIDVKDSNGATVSGLSDVPLKYYLIGPLTTTTAGLNSCTGTYNINLAVVTLLSAKPCDGYTIKVYKVSDNSLVETKTQDAGTTDPHKFTFNLPVGSYKYTATDQCGRTFDSTFSIDNLPDIGAKVLFAGKQCASDPKAKVVIKIEGAEKPVTWTFETKVLPETDPVTWTTLQSSGSFTSDVTTNPSPLPNTGTSDFIITIDNVEANKDYRITFIDSNGCSKSNEFSAVAPSDLAHVLADASLQTTSLNCFGDATGKLTFIGSGGWTQPFDGNPYNSPPSWGDTYLFTLININTGVEYAVNSTSYAYNGANERIGWEAVFTDLPAGTYRLKMKETVASNSISGETFGCEVYFTNTYTISAPAVLSLTGSTKTNVSCFGANDGSINLNPSGGTPNYTYAWTTSDGSGLNATSEDQTGLGPGTYNVTVTDSKNCTVSESFTITQPSELAIALDTSVATAIDCYDDNGIIKTDITAQSSPPYTYTINGTDYNGGGVNVSVNNKTETTWSFSVKAGTYTVTVTDSNGCSKTTPQRTLTQPASGLSVTGTVKADFDGFENGDGLHMTCNGGSNGEIDLTVSGGTPNYTFAWTAVSGSGLDATAEDQTGLTAGVYEVVVTDNTGCSVSRKYIVSDPAPLTIPKNDMADADKGNYQYLGELGTSKYYLSNTSLTYMEARDLAANLGGYLVSIKTQEENQWLIDNSPENNFWLGLDDIVNESKVNGVVDKTKYRWNDGTSLTWDSFNNGEPNDISKDNTTNSPGEDYIEFQNGNWNDIFHHVKRRFVIEYNPTQIADFNGNSISCFGGTNGSIDFVVTGGTTPYTYAWTTADGSGLDATSKSQTGLGAGTYSVTVTDDSGCTKSISYTITQPDDLIMAFDNSVSSSINCFGDNGTLKVDISQESTSPYTYLLEGTDYLGNTVSQSLTNQTVLTQTYNTLKAGTYKVTITDANGCVKVTSNKTLTQPAAGLSITETISSHNGFNITCNGANDGSIDVTVAGGTLPGSGAYTYAWTTTDGSGLDATAQDQTGLGPGTYKLIVTDNNSCTIEKNYTITQPAALAITETVSSHTGFGITCNGANDGSIDITASGGTSTYTYAWTTADGSGLDANAEDQTGLGPGTYKVEITDTNSCKIEKSYTITEPDALSLSQTSSDFNGFDASCSGAVDATIDLTVTGGAATYTYAWTTADGSGLDPTAQDQTGLSAGTYNVTVTDSNGCQISDTFVMTEPQPIVLTSSLSDFNGFNISCNGEADGSIDITVSGGTITGGDTDYTYEWTTTDGSGLDPNVADQTGLTAGTYTIKITDSNNCSLTRAIDIVQADAIDISAVLSDYNGYNISVKGGSDGFINVTPVGGSAGYVYEWSTLDGSGLTAGIQDQTGLTVGTYTLKLTDSNGCNITKSFTLDAPTELFIDLGINATNILCYGDKTGSMTAIITQGSVPSYKYTLNGTDYEGNVVSETVSSITALTYTFLVKAGTYTITVEDLNGGTKTTAQRTYTQPSAPLAISDVVSDFNGFNISCTGASDASIDITVTGGTISGTLYDITWSTSDGSGLQPNIEDQTALGPGTYTVLVKDENSCTITKTYTITEPQPIDYKLDNKKDISCKGANDGAIDITVTKGTGAYTYAWTTTDGSGLDATAEDQSGLSPGTYTLVLSDGCQTLQYIYEIKEPDLLEIELNDKTDILCHGDTTGQILVTVSGGTSPYNYEWKDQLGNTYNRDIGNVFNKGDLSNIPAGIYDLTVTDNNGCQATLQVELKEPDDLIVNVSKSDVTCSNGSDGSITVTASGGVAPYTYSWSDFGNGATRTDLAPGKYTVKVTDFNNCEESVEVEILAGPKFDVSSVVTPITCFGANDGSIKLTIDGGKAPVTLTWADDPIAGTTRSNLKSGVYSVLIKDSSGCEINEIYTITEPAKLQLSAIKSDALDCDDPNSGSIDLQVIGGNPPYTYAWSSGETTEDLNNIPANNYTVLVTDSKGCKVEKTFSIVRPFEITVDLTTSLRVVCETRDVYQVNKVTIDGGVFPYTIKWSDGDVSGANGEIMETNKDGSYSVVVTDNNGCSKSIIFDVKIPVLGYPEFEYTSFYWQTFNALTFNDPITFTNNSTENYLSVSWDFGDGTSSSQNDPVHTYQKKGWYDVTLYVTYFSGCMYSIKKTIYIGDSYEIEIPNAFTPNADGFNDTFRPVYYGFKHVDLKVFDTWGTLIYSERDEKNLMNGWDGRINGKPATNGNYIYQVSGEAYNGESVIKNGPFTLLR